MESYLPTRIRQITRLFAEKDINFQIYYHVRKYKWYLHQEGIWKNKGKRLYWSDLQKFDHTVGVKTCTTLQLPQSFGWTLTFISLAVTTVNVIVTLGSGIFSVQNSLNTYLPIRNYYPEIPYTRRRRWWSGKRATWLANLGSIQVAVGRIFEAKNLRSRLPSERK